MNHTHTAPNPSPRYPVPGCPVCIQNAQDENDLGRSVITMSFVARWVYQNAPGDQFEALGRMMDYYYKCDEEERAYFEREGLSLLYRAAFMGA
jgi:hypothetical protein